jgi:modulator of FtsH protease HflK
MSEFNGQGGHTGPSRPSGVLLQFTRFGDQWRQSARLPWKPILLGLIALLVLLGSVYTVEPEQVGIVLRFGQYVREAKPGLNFKLPLGIESVIKVPVERQLKEEFGFRTVQAGVRTQYSQSQFDDESLMLTGDLNIADVEWVVQYRIVDAYKYLFKVRGVRDTFRAMSEAVVREVVGDRTVNEVLTVGRQEVASLVEQRLQTLCDQYETGLKVEQVVLQNVTPPEKVKPSFNAVNQAQQEKEERINTAQREYNQVIPRAKGQAQQTIEEATGYALDRVNRAKGDAARFDALYEQYRKAPEVTRKRIFLETMGKVLPRAGKKVVVDEDVKGLLPLLNLQGATPVPATGQPGGN